jgi:hypothetical protein
VNDLFTASDLASVTGEFQAIAARAGAVPITEGLLLSRLLRLCMPGLSDAQYAICDDEVEHYVQGQNDRLETITSSRS